MSGDAPKPSADAGEALLRRAWGRSRLAFVNRISRQLDRAEAASKVAMALLVIALGSVMSLQVINRYTLALALAWTQEVSLLCLVWMTFLGASVAVRHHAHFAVTLLEDVMPRSWRRPHIVGVYLLMLVLVGVLLVYGINFAELGLGRLSSAMEIRMIWFYAAIPVSALLMMLYLVERIGIDGFPAEPEREGEA